MTDNGPYADERQARAAALAVVPPEPGWSILRHAQCRQLLDLACEAAGVAAGEYDKRILEWVSGFEDSACAVFAGLITRAYLAGLATKGTEPATGETGEGSG
jgi:hypothetical protein